MTTYPLGDSLNSEERKRFNLTLNQGISIDILPCKYVQAIQTNEFRKPRKGDWYLSGAIPKAYKAENDLPSEYRIMQLIEVEREKKIDFTRY